MIKEVREPGPALGHAEGLPVLEGPDDDAAAAVEHTWTTQDRADIADGLIPASFRSDNIHPNALGSRAIAHRIHTEFKERGWAL